MTRKELIKAIYNSTDLWSCPADPCDFPEEEGNTGDCCLKCAEKQLAEYEANVRKDFAEKIKNHLIRYCHSRLEAQYCAMEVMDYLGELLGESHYAVDVETEMKNHDKQCRADAIDECKEAFNEHLFDSPMMNPIMTRNEILLLLDQLKE